MEISKTSSEEDAMYRRLELFRDTQIERMTTYRVFSTVLRRNDENEASVEDGVGVDVEKWVETDKGVLEELVRLWGCEEMEGIKELRREFSNRVRTVLEEGSTRGWLGRGGLGDGVAPAGPFEGIRMKRTQWTSRRKRGLVTERKSGEVTSDAADTAGHSDSDSSGFVTACEYPDEAAEAQS